MLEGIGRNWEKSFQEKGMAQGMAQGLTQGREEGRAAGEISAFKTVIQDILASRFGGVSSSLVAMLDGISSPAVLKELALKASLTDSPDSFLREIPHREN